MSASLLAGCSTFESDNSSSKTKTTKASTEAAEDDTETSAAKETEAADAKESASENETADAAGETKDTAKAETEEAETKTEAEGSEATGSGSFVWACPSLIGMNPVKSNSNNDYDVYYLTQAGLVRPTEDGYEPDLAERWEISKDKLTYTFYLRDSKWSDGEPVKADDFVYAFSQYLDRS